MFLHEPIINQFEMYENSWLSWNEQFPDVQQYHYFDWLVF